MTESFFSSLRIAVMLLTIDGKVTARERAWFYQLQQHAAFHLSREQKEILRRDLTATADLNTVSALFQRVSDAQDRVRLVKLLKSAISVDAGANPQNLAFYHHIEALQQAAPIEHEPIVRESNSWNELERSTSYLRNKAQRSDRENPDFRTGFLAALYWYFPTSRVLMIIIITSLFALSFTPQCRRSPYRRFLFPRDSWRTYMDDRP